MDTPINKNLEKWDTSKVPHVTDFYKDSTFIKHIEGWDTSKIKNPKPAEYYLSEDKKTFKRWIKNNIIDIILYTGVVATSILLLSAIITLIEKLTN